MANRIAEQLGTLAVEFATNGFSFNVPATVQENTVSQDPLRVYIAFQVIAGVPCLVIPRGKQFSNAEILIAVGQPPTEFWIERHKQLAQVGWDAQGQGGATVLKVITVSYIGE